MRKFVTSLVAAGGVALTMTLGASVPAVAAVPAQYDCTAYTDMSESKVGINCRSVTVGKVRGYAVCAGVDSNIATAWIAAPKNDFISLWSDYTCRWGVRSTYVEAQG